MLTTKPLSENTLSERGFACFFKSTTINYNFLSLTIICSLYKGHHSGRLVISAGISG